MTAENITLNQKDFSTISNEVENIQEYSTLFQEKWQELHCAGYVGNEAEIQINKHDAEIIIQMLELADDIYNEARWFNNYVSQENILPNYQANNDD